MLKKNKLPFLIFLILLITDRVFTLIHFGFQYTDIDQVLLWEGALDYADGIFREPYFYGQNYNFMLESLLAVPLIWLQVPVDMAVPIATSFLAIFPFLVLGFFFLKRNLFLWAYFSILFPLLLPVDYSFLTTIPRGFIQASLFLPLLFFALFDPKEKRSVTYFFVGAGLSFLANPGAVIFILPVGFYLFFHQYKGKGFYLRALLVFPLLFLLWLSNQYYALHPEKVLLEIERIDLRVSALITMLQRKNLFEYLLPLHIWGQFLLLFLVICSIWLGVKKRNAEFLFVFFTVVTLLIALSVPKVTQGDFDSGIFYTSSRLFIQLPLLVLLVLFVVFKRKGESNPIKLERPAGILLLLFVGVLSLGFKNYKLKNKVEKTIEQTTFAVEKTSDLVRRIEIIDSIAKRHDVDVMVTNPIMGWPFAFESFAYRTVMQRKYGVKPKMIAVHNTIDRRSWLYDEAQVADRVMMYVIFPDEQLLKDFKHKQVGIGMTLIYDNTLPLNELFERLDVQFGNSVTID